MVAPDEVDDSTPTLAVAVRESGSEANSPWLRAYVAELRAALSRFRTVSLVEPDRRDVDYGLAVSLDFRPGQSGNRRLQVEAIEIAAGTEPAVYWALVQAYQSGCEIDKMRMAAQRGLALNPQDPGLTVEKVLQFHQVQCADTDYLGRLKSGLIAAGLAQRGKSRDLRRIESAPARLATMNGTQLEYLDMGQGEPIVFVHDEAVDYRAWAHLELPISARYRFIAYSQRFHGDRDWSPPASSPTPYTFSDDLASFIESLRIGPVHLVLVVHGGTSKAYWQAMAQRFAQSIPGAQLATIDGGRHDAPLRQSDALVRLIVAHVDRLVAHGRPVVAASDGSLPNR